MIVGRRPWAPRSRRSRLLRLAGMLGVTILIAAGWHALPRWYTTRRVQAAVEAGTYASAEEGMWALISSGYIDPEHAWILYAGPNDHRGVDPHLWFVTACVCGGRRADGTPTGDRDRGRECDMPGTAFLHTSEGWVSAPELALVGGWAKRFGLAGPGSPVPTHDDHGSHRRCEP